MHEQETKTLNTIYKRRSTRAARPAHLHGYCHPDCDEEDAVCVPEQLPPSDSSRPGGSLSQGKARLHRTSMALGQGTAFFICAKNPRALQSQVGGCNQGLETKYQRQGSTWFSCSPKNFVEIKTCQETRSKHITHHKTRCLTSGREPCRHQS